MRTMRGEWWTERGIRVRGHQWPIQLPNTSARSSTSTAVAAQSSSPPQSSNTAGQHVQATQASATFSKEYVPQLPSIPTPGTAWAAQGGMQALQAPQAPSISPPGTAWAVQGQMQDPQALQAPSVPTPGSAWADPGTAAANIPSGPTEHSASRHDPIPAVGPWQHRLRHSIPRASQPRSADRHLGIGRCPARVR